MCGCFHSSNCAIHNSQYISYSYTDVVHVWRGYRPYTRPTNALKNLPVASRSKIYRFCRSSRQVTGQVRSWVLTVDLHIRTWPVFPRDVGLPDLRNELPIRQGFRKLSSDRHTYRETRPKLYTTPLGGWSINLYWRSSSRSVRIHIAQLMRSLVRATRELGRSRATSTTATSARNDNLHRTGYRCRHRRLGCCRRPQPLPAMSSCPDGTINRTQ